MWWYNEEKIKVFKLQIIKILSLICDEFFCGCLLLFYLPFCFTVELKKDCWIKKQFFFPKRVERKTRSDVAGEILLFLRCCKTKKKVNENGFSILYFWFEILFLVFLVVFYNIQKQGKYIQSKFCVIFFRKSMTIDIYRKKNRFFYLKKD